MRLVLLGEGFGAAIRMFGSGASSAAAPNSAVRRVRRSALICVLPGPGALYRFRLLRRMSVVAGEDHAKRRALTFSGLQLDARIQQLAQALDDRQAYAFARGDAAAGWHF